MSKLLLDESPILVLPSLAKKVGLNESIFIQQLHYWLNDSNNLRDGHKWVYNTYEDWQEQFPFWSISTLRRIITKLEKANLIIIGNYNKLKIDNTKWYRINYEILEHMSRPPVQNEQTECSERTDGEVNLNRPLPEITSEITSEKEEVEEAHDPDPLVTFFEGNGFGTIGSHIGEKMDMWCKDLSPELVLEAMKLTVEYGAKNWNYVESILRTWADKKITTVEQAHALLLAFKEQKAKQRDRPRGKAVTRKEMLPDWFDKREQSAPQDVPKIDDDDFEKQKKELEKRIAALRNRSST